MIAKYLVPALALVWSCQPLFALERCVDKAGRISYSDQACPAGNQSRPVDLSGAGSSEARPPAHDQAATIDGTGPGPRPDDRLKAMKGYLERIERERHSAEREEKRVKLRREISNSERAQSILQTSMDAELKRVGDAKDYANNNLAGATWESSLSQEMSAITQRFDIKIRLASERVQRLRAELAALDGGG